MPWKIARNAYGCSGYAVVKEGTTEVEGCHTTRAAAEKQVAALYASENKKTQKSLEHYEMLDDSEKEYHNALVAIANKYGKFNDSGAAIWAGYESADDNEDSVIGVKCGNCSFFTGESCLIVDAEIEPEGKCRLAAIPPGLVNPEADDNNDDDDDMMEKSINLFSWDGKFLRRNNV